MGIFRYYWTWHRWECQYCDQGVVHHLPAVCPSCGFDLKSPVRDLTPIELFQRYIENYKGHSQVEFRIAK